MEKTLASVAVAMVLALSASVSLAAQDGTTTDTNTVKRAVAADYSKDYLEQVKDEKAADSLSDQKKAEENRKYVQKTMHER